MLSHILLNAAIFSSILMTLVWLHQLIIKDASYVDVFWALGIGAVAAYTTIMYTDLSLRHIIIGDK